MNFAVYTTRRIWQTYALAVLVGFCITILINLGSEDFSFLRALIFYLIVLALCSLTLVFKGPRERTLNHFNRKAEAYRLRKKNPLP